MAHPLDSRAAGSGFGYIPILAVAAALGTVLVATGDAMGRRNDALADVAFWVGILAITVPAAVRLLDRSTSRPERIGVLVVMGMALYVVKLLHSPTSFTLYDEIQHLRTADDILITGGLFAENPLLLVSPRYPGLEVATTVLASVTGTTPFQAGIAVVGAARLLLVLATFLFFEQVLRNDRIAGVATFVYMANPNFIFFDAQFAYESLAIGLVALVLYLTAASQGRWRQGAGVAVVVVAGVIVTHHISTYALIAFLATWTVLWWLVPSARRSGPGPAALTGITIVGAVAWLFLVAPATIEYLGARFVDLLALIDLLLGQGGGRELFRVTGGVLAPEWERIVAFASVFLILIALPIGLVRLWREFRYDPAALALALVTLVYPVTLALRLTRAGSEEAGRSAGFVFFGVAVVVAIALSRSLALRDRARFERPVLAALAFVLVVGGAIVGQPRWVRIPGPYIPGADSRSVEPQSIAAAQWTLDRLGPDRRIVADRVNRLLMGYYGRQRPVTNYLDQVRTYNLFYRPTFGDDERSLLERGDVEYLVVDRRLAGARPLAGPYYESGEPREIAQAGGLTLEGLMKFEDVEGVDVIFDSGDITIFDVRRITTGVRPSTGDAP